MVEPWLIDWSRFIYKNFHHEPIDPDTTDWEFPSAGPLSSVNEALPWKIFFRDREDSEKSFPQFEILRIDPIMPCLYLVSGGFTSRIHLPGWTFTFWKLVDAQLNRWRLRLGIFAVISLLKEKQLKEVHPEEFS